MDIRIIAQDVQQIGLLLFGNFFNIGLTVMGAASIIDAVITLVGKFNSDPADRSKGSFYSLAERG